MTTRLRFLPIFVFFLSNIVLSMQALLAMEVGLLTEVDKYGSIDLSMVHVMVTPQAAAPLAMKMDDIDPGKVRVTSPVFGKLLPKEDKRLRGAQTPEEKFKLGREFAFEKFGRNLLQDERDQIAVSLFEASGTPKALGNLGYLYKEDRAGLSLPEGQRYARAKELLERDNSPWALHTIGDMYRFGRFEHKERRYDIEHTPDYNLAAQYYRKSRSEYSWYALGYLYSNGHIQSDASCCGFGSGRVAHRCFTKARELGYEVPRKKEMICGGFFNDGYNTSPILSCMGGLCFLYTPCCIGYGCAGAIPENRL